MDLLLKDLASGDTSARLAALEKVASKLPNKSWLRDISSDIKMKLMSSSVGAVKDANPKIAVVALNCLDQLIRSYKDDFSPLVNMSFELLLVKVGDNKAAIREQALLVLLELVSNMSISATFERITVNIVHKNQRVKEGLLAVVSRLQELHGPELKAAVSSSCMFNTLSVLLNDSQATTRQLAVSTIANLYPVYREELVDAMGRCEIRPAQQKQLLEALYEQRMRAPAATAAAAAAPTRGVVGRGVVTSPVLDEIDPWSLLDDEEASAHTTAVATAGKGSLSPSSARNRNPASDFSQTSKPAANRRSISASQRRPVNPSTSSGNSFNSTMGASSLASSLSSFAPGDSLGSNGDASRTPSSSYDPEGFMGFIKLKAGLRATEIVDERDLAKLTAKIATELGKKTDWEARTNALISLQKLAWGNLTDFKQSVDLIKGMHDLVSTQIIDLRSTVSKEACKAVAALAYTLRQQFSPLAEVWWLHLIRVVVVKIQVISSSADKCIRVIVATCMDQRLLLQIIESCTAKAPPLRKLGLEYLCLACSAWKPEAIEKNVTALKQVVRVAVTDSDAAARKTARQLYWVLHNSPAMQSHMKGLFKDFDAATQRYVQIEAGCDSPEMTDLFRIVQNPGCLLEHVTKSQFSSSGGTSEASSESVKEALPLKGRPPSTGMKPPTRSSTRSAPVKGNTAPPPLPVEEVISEFDCLMQDDVGEGTDEYSSDLRGASGVGARMQHPSSAGIAGASTASKATRRMSLTGPVRILHPPMQVEERSEESAPSAMKSAAGSRRLSLASNAPPPGRSLARSSDMGAAILSVDHGYVDVANDEAVAGKVVSVSALLQTLGAPLAPTASSLLGQGAVRQLDAKTPAVKSSYAPTSSRPSFITRHEAPEPAETELPSRSQSVASSFSEATSLEMLASKHFNEAPAVTALAPSSSTIMGRRASGAFPLSNAGGAASALSNGPKRFVRAAAPVAAPEATMDVAPSSVVAVQKTSAFLSEQAREHAATTENKIKETKIESESAVFVFSGETLRTMIGDEHWETRVKALESINMRLVRASSTGETLNEVLIETFLDLSVPCLADPHNKVATDALQVLQGCISTYPQFVNSRLGAVLLALFHRLADRRPVVRDQSNSILNLMRTTMDPLLIMTALSPRMGDVPDRMKTALMQFMGAIAPHCEVFFLQASNAWAFLSRMAHIIGSSGAKPSLTLSVAARRLLELVYKTAPMMICTQISALPLQQQLSLKKYLEASVPDIDLQVTQASKAEWSSKVNATGALISPVKMASPQNNSKGSGAGSVAEPKYGDTGVLADVPSSAAQLSKLDAFLTEHDGSVVMTRNPSAFALEDKSLPSPTAVPAAAANSPHPPAPPSVLEFTPRNLSPAAAEVEVRVLEYLDACQYSRSPSENVSPNSPQFSRASSGAKGLPAPVTSPPVGDILSSRQALDEATEEIIQRYSPTRSSPDVAGATSPQNHQRGSPLQAALSMTYDEYSQLSNVSLNGRPNTSSTPQRPSQLPQRRSVGSSSISASPPEHVNSESVHTDLAPSAHQEFTPQKIPAPSSSGKRSAPLSTAAQFADFNDVTRPPSSSKARSSPASTKQLSSVSPTSSAPARVTGPKDTLWMLENLKPTSMLADRDEASKELKLRIKSAENGYWVSNYAQVVTVLLDSFRAEVCSAASAVVTAATGLPNKTTPSMAGYEHVEHSTKSLLQLMRYRGPIMKNLIEVLVDKLCHAGSFVPAPIAQSLEVVLSELAKHDAPRLVAALLPYATLSLENSAGASAVGENPSVRILSLHVLCNSVRHLSSAQLLALLPALVPAVLSSVNSSLADLRKAVIFILVEVYLSVGDAVFPYVTSLTPPQRKLLTIYIEKRLAERKESVSAAIAAHS